MKCQQSSGSSQSFSQIIPFIDLETCILRVRVRANIKWTSRELIPLRDSPGNITCVLLTSGRATIHVSLSSDIAI